ncbi:MAG: DUF1320 family protein, partial [Lentisphaeria bacterium]|nr:DUF1320 family protein [Lentisphaeria bacterium]
RTQIEAELVPADLAALLDDDHDGSEDPGLFALAAARAEARIHAVLAPRYPTPFADPPPAVAEAAILAFCAGLYRRRGTPDAENPFAEREARALAFLRECAAGTAELDAALAKRPVAHIAPVPLVWDGANQEGLC